MTPHAAGQRLSTPKVLLFATVGLVLGYLLVSVSVFLPPLLASHLGASLTAIGSAWAIVRVIDIAVDPALGVIMDRTSTRFGRHRVWLMLGIPILMAAIYALFEAPNGIGFGYLLGRLVFGLTPLVVALVCLRTEEPRRGDGEHVRLRDVKALLAKPDLIRLLLAQLTLTLGPGWMSALYLFFLTQARGFTLGRRRCSS
ncbi:MAG: major facilitator superfamily 1 [Bradyrhizobium sp.]|nr:major facilitator superfamily 1 [Bradyrhizobium sp.]